MTIAQKIRTARIGLGMSQSQFAQALGLQRSQTVSDWEIGKRQPKEYVWLAIEHLKVRRDGSTGPQTKKSQS